MTQANQQSLPAGLSIPQASAPQVPVAPAPQPPAPAPAPVPPVQYQQQAPVVPAGQEPPPQQQFQNPMLTTLAPLAPVTAQPAPVAPAPAPLVPPVVPEAPKPAAPGAVADLAGALGTDPQLAPGIAYLEAQCAASNLDVTRAFGNAADELDARFIDRAYLTEQVGAAQADQMIKVAEASINYAKQYRENLYTEVRAVAGTDQGAWDQAAALFMKHADAGTKEVLAGMLDSMDKAKMLYAANEIVKFAKASGGMVQNAPQPLGAPGAEQGLSREAYQAELAKLPRNAPDSAYDALRQRRAAGLKAGI